MYKSNVYIFLKHQKPSSVVLAVWKRQSPPLSDKAERVKTVTVLSVYFVLPQKVFFFLLFLNLAAHGLASINMVKCRVCLRHPHFHQNSERPDVISLSGVLTYAPHKRIPRISTSSWFLTQISWYSTNRMTHLYSRVSQGK